MFDAIVITCEHAGNHIPPAYLYLFEGKEELINSHRGWDPGALEAARYLADGLQAPLFYTETCRLLVEANRSIGFKDHFSEYTSGLPDKEKQVIIEEYYMPFRRQAEAFLEHLIYSDKNVLHLSVHSLTPVLNGRIREMDISFLFDEAREAEYEFCKALKAALLEKDSKLAVKFNYPYLGTDDGFTTHLRRLFTGDKYAGIEIEFNQQYILDNDKARWKHMQYLLLDAIKNTARLA